MCRNCAGLYSGSAVVPTVLHEARLSESFHVRVSLQGDIALGESPRQALPMTYNISVLPQPSYKFTAGVLQGDSHTIIWRCEFGYV